MANLQVATAVASILLFFPALSATSHGPVRVERRGDCITLSNDYLERTLQITDGTLASDEFTNRLSHRTYNLAGDEFEIDLTFAQLERDSENPHPVTSHDFEVTDLTSTETPGGGQRVTLHLVLTHPLSDYTGLEADLIYELNPPDFYMRQRINLKTTGKGTFFLHSLWPLKGRWSSATFRLGGLGQPLLADDLFLGLEYPSSLNISRGDEVKLGSIVGLNIPHAGFESETVVLGVAMEGESHARFMDYVQRIRMSAPRPFILYNTWYDLQGTVMNAQNTLERIPLLEENLLRRYSLHLDSFVLDDGWDDPKNLWRIDAGRFPNGFHDLVPALRKADSSLGIWFGPLGGYGGGPATNRSVRIDTGRRMGMEVNSTGEYFCLAGTNYSAYLRDSMLRMIRDYGVNYFKLDGIPFACNQPGHGHGLGVYSREAYVRTVIDLAKSLHTANPGAFISLATGPWLSPWWLRYADTVDYGGEDFAYLDAVPSFSPRQSALSYNDSVLYHDYVVKGVQFPMSSLDGEGIIKGKYNLLGGENEPLEDWEDALVNFVGSGLMRADLYLSPTLLTPNEWEALGPSLQYMKMNAHPLLDNGTWILGDPAKGEPYGFVHASAAKTIVLLRNPSRKQARASFPLSRENGFEPTQEALQAEILFPFREALPHQYHFGEAFSATLNGFEERVIELRPASANEMSVQGIRFRIQPSGPGSVHFRVFAPRGEDAEVRLTNASAIQTLEVDGRNILPSVSGQEAVLRLHFGMENEEERQPVFSAPLIPSRHLDRQQETLQVSFSVEIPTDFAETKLGLLLQTASAGSAKVELRDSGKAVSFQTRKSAGGTWCWFGSDLSTGYHRLQFNFHLPAEESAQGRISGWLWTQRKLAQREVLVKFHPGITPPKLAEDLLPESSPLERRTYTLFDEDLP